MTQFKNVKVLIASGALIDLEDWQKQYGIPVGSDFIGKYFSLEEPRFKQDLFEFGVLIVNAPLMVVMDRIRQLYGPLTISSYNRTEAYQKKLLEEPDTKGLRAETSPHVAKMAADLDVKTMKDVLNLVPLARQASKDTGIPIRIGHQAYFRKSIEVEETKGIKDTWTFVHIDVCPLFYAKGMPFHEQPHPVPWELQIEW